MYLMKCVWAKPMSMSTYLGARRVLSPPLASLCCGVCSITLSLLVYRNIRVMALRWPLLVLLMWIVRFGVVDDRTIRGEMGRLEEVALEGIEVDITGE